MSASANDWQYRTGPAGLFAVMARDTAQPEEVVIPCPECRSENTEMIDHEHQIYRCRSCGELFERPPG